MTRGIACACCGLLTPTDARECNKCVQICTWEDETDAPLHSGEISDASGGERKASYQRPYSSGVNLTAAPRIQARHLPPDPVF